MTKPLLSIRNLTIQLADEPKTKILDNVSLDVPPLSIVAVVGGSGSGKTTLAYSVLKLLSPALKMTAGEILFEGQNIAEWGPLLTRKLRGEKVGMVFQEPLHAFNPVFTIGEQILEVVDGHSIPHRTNRPTVHTRLRQVGLTDTERIFNSYPHQLSGGMRQRAMIAQALAARPSLLIADEPTSSLDVTLQAKILELFRHLRDELKLSIVLITHDLGVVAHLADHVVVLERGKVVESGPTKDIVKNPKHPYTQKLMRTLS